MNNLKLILLALAAASALFAMGQTMLKRARTSNASLSEQIAQITDVNSSLTSQIGTLRKALAATDQLCDDLRSQLNASHSEAIPLLEPDREGVWPTNKPYFYLPKSALRYANFQQFQGSHSGLRITADCATVLGMSPAEASGTDSRFEQLVVEFKRREQDSLQRCPTNLPGNYLGKKTSYRIPPLRDAMIDPLQVFSGEVTDLLGGSRAELVLDWVKLCVAESLGDFGTKARIFTFTEDPHFSKPHLTRLQIADEDGKFLSYLEIWTPPRDEFPTGFPEELRPRFPWRHLFGENAEQRADPWKN
jgi:hypothetical protein